MQSTKVYSDFETLLDCKDLTCDENTANKPVRSLPKKAIILRKILFEEKQKQKNNGGQETRKETKAVI